MSGISSTQGGAVSQPAVGGRPGGTNSSLGLGLSALTADNLAQKNQFGAGKMNVAQGKLDNSTRNSNLLSTPSSKTGKADDEE